MLKKRITALILATLLVSSTVACGSEESTGNDDSTSTSHEVSTTEKEESPYESLEDRNFEGRIHTQP